MAGLVRFIFSDWSFAVTLSTVVLYLPNSVGVAFALIKVPSELDTSGRPSFCVCFFSSISLAGLDICKSTSWSTAFIFSTTVLCFPNSVGTDDTFDIEPASLETLVIASP